MTSLRQGRIWPAVWLVVAACEPSGSVGGGGVVIPTQPLDEPVAVGSIGAGLPVGFIQQSVCRIDATVSAAALGPEPELVYAELAFDDKGRVETIEQRFPDVRSSDLQLWRRHIELTYDDLGRLVRIHETDLDFGGTRDSELSYAGDSSRVAEVLTVDALGDIAVETSNRSRVYDGDDRVVRYEDSFDAKPLIVSYFYDRLGRLDNVFVRVDSVVPLPLASFEYNRDGGISSFKLPVLDVCSSIDYDDAGYATASEVNSCTGGPLADVAFDNCADKALAFWTIFTLNAY